VEIQYGNETPTVKKLPRGGKHVMAEMPFESVAEIFQLTFAPFIPVEFKITAPVQVAEGGVTSTTVTNREHVALLRAASQAKQVMRMAVPLLKKNMLSARPPVQESPVTRTLSVTFTEETL